MFWKCRGWVGEGEEGIGRGKLERWGKGRGEKSRAKLEERREGEGWRNFTFSKQLNLFWPKVIRRESVIFMAAIVCV